ncbi:hypothetical protein SKAU_G00207750 [Synaphobranchus kaupii]|uniref:ribonuclease H n=1 Tax=Synaphobranchus kaupii TaxID=118154 RepID=A0A9Q1IUQ5_SYNKA|nr:hypothetical protein SKAU_G00207750 [Synaphobranchus kaupii]
MERLGIVRRSNSPWASPLHMVTKADGGWRPCGDFRRLNNATTPDRYPIPHIQDFSAHLAGASVFSKVDLVRGYHQVPVHPQDVPKTAVITPFGLFEFLRMPFGLKGAAQTFQRLMDSVLRDMPFLFVYLDDILVASPGEGEHLSHLRLLFERLSEHGLIVNPAKCQFGLSSISFLGHHITQQGAVPLPARVDAVTRFPRPRTVRSLQEFLGMVNFYNCFIPHAAHVMRPLYEALRGKVPKDEVDWSPGMDDAFGAAKSALAAAALLAHPSPTSPVALTTDASDYAVGAVCEQWVNGAWQPLAFFSRQLRDNEKKYSTFDRELLGLFLATRHFRFLLEGRQFTAFVDHKPLTFAMAKTSEPWSGRQQRQLSAISEFTTDIQHVAGKDNSVADCLSRAVAGSVHLGLDYAAMAADQAADSDIQTYRTASTGLCLEDVVFDDANATLVCDVSTDSET